MKATGLPRLRRLAWTMVGLSSFLWIGYEDRGTTAVLLLAAAWCTAVALQLLGGWLTGATPSAAQRLLRFAAGGLAAGLGVGPASALLMLVKLSLHAHPTLDFSLAQILDSLRSTPLRAAQGAALGMAVGGLGLLSRRG